MQPTPGPWRLSPFDPHVWTLEGASGPKDCRVYAILGPPEADKVTHPHTLGCPILAQVLGGKGCSPEQLLADARLVASAPVLLAFVQRLGSLDARDPSQVTQLSREARQIMAAQEGTP